MNYATRFIQFIAYSNCWIGLGAVLFSLQFYLLENLPPNYPFLVFVFFSTILTYTFQRHVKILAASRIDGERIQWMKSNPMLVKVILAISLIGAIYPLLYFNRNALLALVFLGAISLFYVIKIPLLIKKNLRDIPGLKIFLIALVWSATGSFLPYLNADDTTLKLPFLLFGINFIYIIAITIPFDIRDLDLDETEKKTIPQLLGKKTAIWISILFLLLHYGVQSWCFSTLLLWSTISLALAILLVAGNYRQREDLYYSFLIDGLLILQPLLLWADLAFKTSV